MTSTVPASGLGRTGRRGRCRRPSTGAGGLEEQAHGADPMRWVLSVAAARQSSGGSSGNVARTRRWARRRRPSIRTSTASASLLIDGDDPVQWR